uniref:Uncharacterized protein n=1 Tax=Anguilla anguilla TaxID=7936 RepID=A0A0E9PBC1_ANGAN
MADEIFKDSFKYTVMYPYDFSCFFNNKSKIYKRSPSYIQYKKLKRSKTASGLYASFFQSGFKEDLKLEKCLDKSTQNLAPDVLHDHQSPWQFPPPHSTPGASIGHPIRMQFSTFHQ